MKHDINVLKVLGDALIHGKTDNLRFCMTNNCTYESDYAGIKMEYAKDIIERMNIVYENLSENNQYSCEYHKISELLKLSKDIIDNSYSSNFLDDCIILRQMDIPGVAAIVLVATNNEGKITKILLSRNEKWFDVEFCYREAKHSIVSLYAGTPSIKDITLGENNIKLIIPDSFNNKYIDTFMKAFNNESVDDNIIVSDIPKVVWHEKIFMNKGAFNSLKYRHQQHGDVHYGYISYDGSNYDIVPYLGNYCFYTFLQNENGELLAVSVNRFDVDCNLVKRFFCTDCTEMSQMCQRDITVSELDLSALKVIYEHDAASCYAYGKHYSEPHICDEIIYENKNIIVRKQWSWKAGEAYFQGNGSKVCLTEKDYGSNDDELWAFVDYKGKISPDDYFDCNNFSCGLAAVKVPGKGWGYINEQMEYTIPPQYDNAYDFSDGVALVRKDDYFYCVDTEGKVLFSKKYGDVLEVYNYSKGLSCFGCVIEPEDEYMYYKAQDRHKGKTGLMGFGFMNKKGDVVIAPEYTCVDGFTGDYAIVERSYKNHISEEDAEKIDANLLGGSVWKCSLKGLIDIYGKEILPCNFSEILAFNDVKKLWRVKDPVTEKWGIIDDKCNWKVTPRFNGMGSEYNCGKIVVYDTSDDDIFSDKRVALYDLNTESYICDFVYGWIKVLDDGKIYALYEGKKSDYENNDEDYEDDVCHTKLLGSNGTDFFNGKFKEVTKFDNYYKVDLALENKTISGIFDNMGNEVVSCKYDMRYVDGVDPIRKLFIYHEHKLSGLMSFDEETIITPRYKNLEFTAGSLLEYTDNKIGKKGLVSVTGAEITGSIYDDIKAKNDDTYICELPDGTFDFIKVYLK